MSFICFFTVNNPWDFKRIFEKNHQNQNVDSNASSKHSNRPNNSTAEKEKEKNKCDTSTRNDKYDPNTNMNMNIDDLHDGRYDMDSIEVVDYTVENTVEK